MNKRRSPDLLLLIGTIACFGIGAQYLPALYRAVWTDPDIWWTGRSVKLPIEETRDSFELYIAGKPLQRHLSERTLLLRSREGEPVPVVPGQVRARLNNYDRVKSERLARTLWLGPAFGAALTLFLLGLIRSLGGTGRSGGS